MQTASPNQPERSWSCSPVADVDAALFTRAAPIIFEVGRAGPSGLLLEEAHQVARIREAVRIGQLADAAPLEE